jgi:hypothetical protein
VKRFGIRGLLWLVTCVAIGAWLLTLPPLGKVFIVIRDQTGKVAVARWERAWTVPDLVVRGTVPICLFVAPWVAARLRPSRSS